MYIFIGLISISNAINMLLRNVMSMSSRMTGRRTGIFGVFVEYKSVTGNRFYSFRFTRHLHPKRINRDFSIEICIHTKARFNLQNVRNS